MSKNNITGDNLVSKPTEGYQDGWDRIWYTKIEDELDKEERILIKDNEKVTND